MSHDIAMPTMDVARELGADWLIPSYTRNLLRRQRNNDERYFKEWTTKIWPLVRLPVRTHSCLESGHRPTIVRILLCLSGSDKRETHTTTTVLECPVLSPAVHRIVLSLRSGLPVWRIWLDINHTTVHQLGHMNKNTRQCRHPLSRQSDSWTGWFLPSLISDVNGQIWKKKWPRGRGLIKTQDTGLGPTGGWCHRGKGSVVKYAPMPCQSAWEKKTTADMVSIRATFKILGVFSYTTTENKTTSTVHVFWNREALMAMRHYDICVETQKCHKVLTSETKYKSQKQKSISSKTAVEATIRSNPVVFSTRHFCSFAQKQHLTWPQHCLPHWHALPTYQPLI